MAGKLTKEDEEILFSDFPDHDKDYDFDRETIEKYSRNTRDFRIATGRWYTPKEMEERAKKAFSVKLY